MPPYCGAYNAQSGTLARARALNVCKWRTCDVSIYFPILRYFRKTEIAPLHLLIRTPPLSEP